MQGHPDRSLKNFLPFLIILFGIFVYWMYLAFVTEPILVHDAKGYEDLGRMIYQKGWEAYFVSGPNREPIYPFLVSWSMHIANTGSYADVLKCFQIVLLSASAFLFLKLLQRACLSKKIIVLAMLYLGISPAIVNASFSMFSEGVTYSFVLGIVLVSSVAWRSLPKDTSAHALALGLGLGVLFVLILMVKGVYEKIFPLFLIPFVFLALHAWRVKNNKILKNSVVFLLSAIIVFGTCVFGYKSLNKKYNGVFVLTDRAAWAFYAAAARRQMPLSAESFGAAVTYCLFEEEGCKRFFSAEHCQSWHVRVAEHLGAEKNYEVSAKFPLQQQNEELFKAAFEKISENPLQYALLVGLEWVHMFFWENTRTGFVAYPDWLDKIFDCAPFAKGLRFAAGGISFLATLFAIFFLWKNKKGLLDHSREKENFVPILFFSVYLIVCHVTFYSLFAIVSRHALPIAPLFILVVAFTTQILLNHAVCKFFTDLRSPFRLNCFAPLWRHSP